MTAYVFLGPTLPVERARDVCDAVYLPPVAQGDVHRVLRRRPSLIGIVDGYFERVPAVWHKEILWALDQGVPVLGAASMGALRAAELDVFGMEGVGRVYEAFRDGALTDDDEVAVAHALPEDGHRPLSEAMVSIRRTLDDAAAARVVTAKTHALVVDAAKSLFYAERTYEAAIAVAAEAGADPGELHRLRRWVAEHGVDQKREDALELLATTNRRLRDGDTSVTTTFTFQHTDFWYEAQRSAGELSPEQLAGEHAEAGPTATAEAVLDELRLNPERHQREWARALARRHAVEEARRAGVEVDLEQLQATADAFRRERGLHSPEAARAWRATNDLTHDDAERLMSQEAQVRWAQAVGALPVAEMLPDQLRVSGAYPELVARARDKAQRLAETGRADTSLADLDAGWEEVVAWYFGQRLGTEVPEDLGAFAVAHGYTDEAHLRRVLVREYSYTALEARPDPHDAPA